MRNYNWLDSQYPHCGYHHSILNNFYFSFNSIPKPTSFVKNQNYYNKARIFFVFIDNCFRFGIKISILEFRNYLKFINLEKLEWKINEKKESSQNASFLKLDKI